MDKTNSYKKYLQEMKDSILKYGWDGKWFLRAYDDFGNKIGSKDNIEGQIFNIKTTHKSTSLFRHLISVSQEMMHCYHSK